MLKKYSGQPSAGFGFDFVEELAELGGGELVEVGDLEVHGKLDFVAVGAVHLGEVGDGGLVGFGDKDGLGGVAVGELAELAEDLVGLGEVVGVLVLDVAVAEGVCSRGGRGRPWRSGSSKRRDTASMRKPAMPLSSQNFMTPYMALRTLGVAPVEVGLLGIEIVVVVLAGGGVGGPGGVAEPGLPVVGIAAVLAVAPDVPVTLGIGLGGAGLLEPGVLVGGVVEDDVHDDADVVFFGGLEELVEVAHGAVLGVDGLVVGDVVAEVDLGRGITWG